MRTDPVSYDVTVHAFSPQALFSRDEENVPLRRLDKVVVATQVKAPRIVTLMGEMRRPGNYTIRTGERLSSVLKRAGEFTPDAYPPGIVLIRESVRRKQQEELARFLTAERRRLTAESASVAAGKAEVRGQEAAGEQQVLALRLQQLEATVSQLELGRVVVRLETIEQLERTEDDLRLEAGDQITIPQPSQTVSIIGSVKSPGNVVHRRGLGLEEYLNQVGGPTEQANTKEMYIVRANGAAESGYLRMKEMQPGDTIVVPQKIEAKTPQLLLWQTVASILGSLAITAAGITVIATN